ncbi:hypothetical protein [Herpetosiphon geysericola]|uniref:Uncharacterized protein n=1 Tax=Herpetosiphon geysericola TaxID=70996 RepID=A0A0P6YY32_9CHLR|nr:hypothetical protein [Herpetosiphon geysericola]KPL89008.1 hypothetical protein SE18_10200 [Herpetosiphon geysericola]
MRRGLKFIMVLLVVSMGILPDSRSHGALALNTEADGAAAMVATVPVAFVEGTWNPTINTPDMKINSMAVANERVYIIAWVDGSNPQPEALRAWNPLTQEWTLLQANTASNRWTKLQTGRDGRLYALHTIYGSSGTIPQRRVATYNGSAWVDVTPVAPLPSNSFNSYIALSNTEIYMIDNNRSLLIWNGTTWTIKQTHEDGPGIEGIADLQHCGDGIYFTYVEAMQVNEHVVTTLEELRKYSPATGTFSVSGGRMHMAICEGANRYSFYREKIHFELANTPTRIFATSYATGSTRPWVFAMVRIGGYIYVTGSFDTVDGVKTGDVARWNGSRWEGLGPEFSSDRISADAIVGLGHQVYVAGFYLESGTGDGPHIAAWAPTMPYTTYNPLVSHKP